MLGLLASRGLFVGLIVLAVVVVLLSIGISVLLFLRLINARKTLEADVVKRELNRRETETVIRLVKENAAGKDKEALLNELRRVKSAEMLVDEIIKTEKAERGIVDKPPKKKPAKRPSNPAPRRPAVMAQKGEANAQPAQAEAENKAAPAAKEQKKPEKKKDDLEFKPSDN